MFETAKPRVVHLIDDTTAGGVMRVLDHLTSSPALAEPPSHNMLRVTRGQISLRRIRADVIVSHLSISWRTLPSLIALRARHPFAKIVWLGKQGLVPEAKLRVIQSYIDLQSFEDIPDRSGPIRIFGAIGRFDRQKGFDTLIKAFRKTTDPDLRLYLFGEGEEETTLRTLAKGDARIQFKGFVSDPLEAHRMVDAVVMPSRWEAYGLVAIEALSAGRVLICSACDGLQDHAAFGAHILGNNTIENWFDIFAAQDHGFSPRDGRSITQVLEANNVENWRSLVDDLV